MDFSKILDETNNLKESISCSTCKDILKETFVLPCDHNFCETCLKDLNSLCSECNQPFLVREIKEDKFSNSILNNLQNIIEIASKKDEHVGLPEIQDYPEDMKEFKLVIRAETKRNPKGETPLHLACKRNNVNQVEELINKNVDINMKDYANWAPLHEAVENIALDCITCLLKAGALPNIPGESYITPLHKAVASCNTKIIKLLLDYGANPTLADYNGKTPIDWSLSEDTKILLKMERKKVKIRRPLFVDLTPRVYLDMKKKYIPTTDSSFITFASLNDFKKGIVTHFVIEESEMKDISPLLLSFAIVQGACVVREEWLNKFVLHPKDYLGFEYMLQEKRDVIKKSVINKLMYNPPLFDGINFFFTSSSKPHHIKNTKFTKEDLITLVTLGGGKLLSRQPALRTVENQFNYPYHVGKTSEFTGCCNVIIYDESNPPLLLYNMKELKHRSSAWLIECILNFSIVF